MNQSTRQPNRSAVAQELDGMIVAAQANRGIMVNDVLISQIWRYPVKSLRAEPLESTELTLDGIPGDRIVHVVGPKGPLTGRTRKGLLTVPLGPGQTESRF